MKNNILKLAGIFVLILVGVGAYVFLGASPSLENNSADTPVDELSPLRGTSVSADSENKLLYTNNFYGFSLEYPNELKVQEFDEGQDSATIVFQKPNELVGFQMFITPYSETTITKERAAQDIPSGVVRDLQEVVIGKENIPAVIFFSEAPIIGESREVWFIHEGYLYEITTYKELDTWIAEIVQTLDFN